MINKVIFDYGGVFVKNNRSHVFCDALHLNNEQSNLVTKFFRSDFIKKSALGYYDEHSIMDRLQKIFSVDKERISKAFDLVCEPDNEMVSLLDRLNMKCYKTILVSNSIPPYTRRIRKNINLNFSDLFFSDEIAKRKPIDIFDSILQRQPLFFEKSIYIDDQEKNLIFPKRNGAIPILFRGVDSLIDRLNTLGVV